MRVLRAAAVGMVLLALIAVGPTPSAAELKINIGGYIKLDMAYQDQINKAGTFRVDPDPGSVAFDHGPGKDDVRSKNDQFLLDARESRFHLNVGDEIGTTKLRAFIQVDFFGSDTSSLVSNSHNPRLRHAWASGETPLGPGSLTVLAGQTWSTFMNVDVASWDLVDFNGPAGELFARQPQLRLTYGIPYGKNSLNIIGAVQAQSVNFTDTSKSSGLLAAGVSPARQEGENVPAFVGKLQWISEYLKAEGAVIYSKAKGIAPSGDRQEADVYGFQASASVPLGPLTIDLHADRMSGINREANGDFPDAVFLGTGKDVGVITSWGGWGGISYKLTPKTTVSGHYGIRTADSSGFSGFGRGTISLAPCTAANATSPSCQLVRQQSIHVTLLQQFWQRFQFGIEYERQWVDAFRQNSGSQNIVHGALWMFF